MSKLKWERKYPEALDGGFWEANFEDICITLVEARHNVSNKHRIHVGNRLATNEEFELLVDDWNKRETQDNKLANFLKGA